ncbi:MAG TPA: zf-HC2 domain-containing protein [Gemmatimonadaceae bacterium]|nr:zf-HC2 domain-containing protein [Gemmatimonadaceae bacterium]
MTTTHISVEILGDYLDGVLSDGARRDVAAHLAACAECGRRLEALERLRAHAAAAPRAIAPPDDLWPAIRAAIAERKTVAVPRAAGAWRRPAALAAAALLIAAVSSLATWRIARTRGGAELVATAASSRPASARGDTSRDTNSKTNRDTSGRSALLRYVTLERDYDRTAAELRATLEAQRATLAPATVATVERSLRTIDDAIAEARAALDRDPGNQALLQMLTATHEQRLDLLRRATHIQSGA